MIPNEFNAALEPPGGEAQAEAVREMLQRTDLTLYRLAALSRARYRDQAAFLIRRNFYSQLRSGLSPTLQQVLALAELTDSRVWDWLAIFGFSLVDIPRLQVIFARPRTTLIDDDLVDPESLLPSFRHRRPDASFQLVTPLSQLLERSGSYVARNLIAPVRGDFVYAKIGSGDALARPDILPGSIVRADTRLVRSFLLGPSDRHSRAVFLVKHSRGFTCSRLRVSGPDRVAFITSDPTLINREFRVGSEAQILGVVDLELRFHPVSQKHRPTQIVPSAETWNPNRTPTQGSRRPGAFLRIARLRAGLSFRSASKLSGSVAKILGNDRYFTSPGTLSDYEARDKMPRHIHKLFTLAIIYCMGFREMLRSFGIALENFDRIKHSRREKDEPSKGFFESIREEFGDFPLFLADALPALSGLAHISLRDFFRLERNRDALHPSLSDARFILVNRRTKTPRRNPRAPAWSQPLYLLQERDGTYIAASCAIEDGRLMLYAYPQSSTEKQPARRHIDADVVGQVVGIARSMLSPP